jgi:hypothetical protein
MASDKEHLEVVLVLKKTKSKNFSFWLSRRSPLKRKKSNNLISRNYSPFLLLIIGNPTLALTLGA